MWRCFLVTLFAKPIPDGYVCKICSVPGHWIQDCPQGKAEREARQAGGGGRHASRPPRDPNAKCWFCLGSADVEKHLISSIGTGAYLAMPKGAINEGHVRSRELDPRCQHTYEHGSVRAYEICLCGAVSFTDRF